jgi:hypothetical protein
MKNCTAIHVYQYSFQMKEKVPENIAMWKSREDFLEIFTKQLCKLSSLNGYVILTPEALLINQM